MKFIHCFAHFVLCRLEKDKIFFFFLSFFVPFKQNRFNAIDTENDFPVIDFNIIFMSLQNRILLLFKLLSLFGLPKDSDKDVSCDKQ